MDRASLASPRAVSAALAAVLAAVLVAVVLLTAGCRNGPPGDELRAEVQARLDASFGDGVLAVADFTRRGSYTWQEEGDERERLLVYYDATLRFETDHRLTGWDQLGVGSLIDALGATPQGVEGVAPDGNRAGDELLVRGTVPFVRAEDDWQATNEGPSAPAVAPDAPAASDEPAPYRRKLEAIAAIGVDLRRAGADAEIERLEGELEAVLRGAKRRNALRRGEWTIATGLPGGTYHALGAVLAAALSDGGSPTLAFESSGSVENCRLVGAREATFGLAQNDVAEAARSATGLFAAGAPLEGLRAVATLYPEPVHVVAAPGVGGLADLAGKRVAVGPAGSGGRVNALQVLAAAGLSLSDFEAALPLGPTEAAAALEAGRIDAFLATGAAPLPAVSRLAGRADVQVLSLGDALAARLAGRHAFFVPLTLPPGTYPGQSTPIRTVAVTATLVTHDAVPDRAVTALLERLFAERAALARHTPQAWLIARDTARAGLSIPLHPAAAAFLGGR